MYLLALKKGTRKPGAWMGEMVDARCRPGLTAVETQLGWTTQLLSAQLPRWLRRAGLDLSAFALRVWLSHCSPALGWGLSPRCAVPKVFLRQYSPCVFLRERRCIIFGIFWDPNQPYSSLCSPCTLLPPFQSWKSQHPSSAP